MVPVEKLNAWKHTILENPKTNIRKNMTGACKVSLIVSDNLFCYYL